MFDIEIVLPVSQFNKYAARLEAFKKYGLVNIQRRKVLLKVLVGAEKILNIEDGWSEDIKVDIVECKHNQIACKICDYYANRNKEEIQNTRWFAKFDDDSTTDINGLIENLDLEFDHTRDFYVVTELCKDKHNPEIELLNKIGYQKWVNNRAKPIVHEWEGCVLSQSAMHRIYSNPQSIEFLRMRTKIPTGVGDVSLAIAARMVKIYPAECNFMSKQPLVHRFSFLGGDLNHIHYLSEDVNKRQYDFLKLNINHSISNESYCPIKYEQILNKDYAYCRDEYRIIAIIKLNDNGTFFNIDNENERFWEIRGNELHFLTTDCRSSSIFTLGDNLARIEGRYMFEDNVKHLLRLVL